MRRRVRRILLISSLYDSFTLSEDGQVTETLLSHFIDLNRGIIPSLVHVSDCATALKVLQDDRDFDLVIPSIKMGGVEALELARGLRALGSDVPILGLAHSRSELAKFSSADESRLIERVFLWLGDVRIFSAMVMYLEDRLNVAADTALRGVPSIIVVEDNVRFYSSFLPTIYTQILANTRRLLSEGLDVSQQMIRMQARPKVLLATNYEEAWNYFERFGDNVLGVISDFAYPRAGKIDPHAGQKLCRRILELRPDIRLVMQSSQPNNEERAFELGASFLLKGSPLLLQRLGEILVGRFGFGDFIFRMNGKEIERAADPWVFEKKLATLPPESVVYHAERNHFSNWLKARTEFDLAAKVQADACPLGGDPEVLRRYLLETLAAFRHERDQTVVSSFDRKPFESAVGITRIGAGSLGGKGRGVAFVNRLLHATGVQQQFPDVDVYAPPAGVLATDVFDEFVDYERLHELALAPHTDEEITSYFLQAPFPREAGFALREFLQDVPWPLAVRSSSLLEDSLSQPFAGVYRTFMVPNNDLELDVRWNQLTAAVKRVYASTFSEQAKTYLSMTSHRLEEEKMAVMIQQLVGQAHGDRFYPDFSGVARSHNYYPEPGQSAEDGVAAVALGLGKTVVGGDPCLRFCPKYPQHIVRFSSVKDALRNSQRDFWALDLRRAKGAGGKLAGLVRHPLEVAEEDGTLTWTGSTYSPENDRIVDGISREGVRLVTFAHVLKHRAFPLAELLNVLLSRCAEGTGAPVEIEFAGNFGTADRRPQFAFLQLRPVALSTEGEAVAIGTVADDALICRSPKVLGNGRFDELTDLVVVDVHRFQRSKTQEVAQQVARFDALLRKEHRPYILIGVGRWGSSDPSLGIPVSWNQIAGARVIVEAGFEDIRVAPSQGTHFFQNLTSSNVGYFSVNAHVGEGHVDWDWLAGQPPLARTEFVTHLRLPAPAVVKMDGRTGEGIISKPA